MSNQPGHVVVHMIGNAHIDPVWMWRMDEGRAEVLATYRSAIELMRETPGFIFSSGGAVTYRWVQADDPALFAAIRQRVAEGRWSLVNGWWLQPDCNIPAGESLAGQGLYGQLALTEMFGRRAVTGYNVDSFGHAGSLPQILAGCGLINYVFFRPQPFHEKDLPGTLFWWESDDGSRVLTSRPPLHYPSHGGDLIDRIDMAAEQAPPDVGHVMCFYGVGNHGGGPSRENLASILKAMDHLDGLEVRFGSTDRFFQLVRGIGASLPVVHDELQHHARGCYSAVSKIKWYNRKCETALLTAEKAAALGHLYWGADYPRVLLTRAWERVLFNQFHDILAGTSLREACEDTYRDYEESLTIAGSALGSALQALADRIDMQSQDRCLLVFNPLSWQWQGPVDAAVIPTEVWNEDWPGLFRPGVVRLWDDEGREVPTQVTAIEHRGAHYVVHLTFWADLPALGYRCYRFSLPEDAPTWAPPGPASLAAQSTPEIENNHLRLTVDAQSGWLVSLFDKASGVEMLGDAGGVPLIIDDPSDTWSHDVVAFDQVLDRCHADGKVYLVEQGPVRQVVRAVFEWGCSTITCDYVLYAQSAQVIVDLAVDWHEQLKALKIAFPWSFQNAQSTSSVPYGSICRLDDGGEEPCQAWVDVSGEKAGAVYGVAVLNDCKYSYGVLDGELRMTILRSPVYAFHRPRQIQPGVLYEYTDQGEQRVRMALVPHAGTWEEGGVVRAAEALNARPAVREFEAGSGDWPAAASLVRCSAPNVILAAVKLAEKGNDLIVRAVETLGQETDAEVAIGPGTAKAQGFKWRRNEIKTLRLDARTGVLSEVNMLEE